MLRILKPVSGNLIASAGVQETVAIISLRESLSEIIYLDVFKNVMEIGLILRIFTVFTFAYPICRV